MRILLSGIFMMLIIAGTSQNYGYVEGIVTNELEQPVPECGIKVLGTNTGTVTDNKGHYILKVPADQDITIKYSTVEYWSKKIRTKVNSGETKQLNIALSFKAFEAIEVQGKEKDVTVEKIQSIPPSAMSSAAENIESTLQSQGFGVRQNNELSAGYSVRGGNFNENLVYVNDIEIYRPFLARSGQQEGLSFINPYMVGNIKFSSGGFDAKYGDKLSSVLDVKYKETTTKGELNGSVVTSLLGASAYVQHAPSTRFNFITGYRYRTNQYLLGALDTKGEYRPIFADYQGMFNYALKENLKLTFFGSYSKNEYRVIPQSRETNFGNINQALRFTVYYDGKEVTQFETYMGALSLTHEVNENLTLKYFTSIFHTVQFEHFDLLGEYKLDELERDLGNSQYGDVAFNRGVGAFLNHARNDIDALVANAYHKGYLRKNKHYISWGAKYQIEQIRNKINEWKYVDSARFNIPHPADSVGYVDPTAQPYQYLNMSYKISADNYVSSARTMGYIQDRYTKSFPKEVIYFDSVKTADTAYAIHDTINTYKYLKITGGVRANYWTFNNQTVVSPRASLNYQPAVFLTHNGKVYRRQVNIRLASGYYYQPPFYRAMRNLAGQINPMIRAQKSIHFIAGGDFTFYKWNRPFKFGAEAYYKLLRDIIPYQIDNIRVLYYGKNDAKGYATGLDMKLNGEFIKGVESYMSLSFLKTQENITDDYYYTYYNAEGQEIIKGYTADQVATDSTIHYPGYIPRPTDQRVSFSMFFQDRMPKEWDTPKIKFSTMKMNLTMIFGTRLPYGPPGDYRYKDTLRSTLYKRVDIGFSKEFLTDKTRIKDGSIWKKVDKMWVSFEVFNLLDISNTMNYTWIKDVTGRQYSIPSYMTSRRLNLKLVVQF